MHEESCLGDPVWATPSGRPRVPVLYPRLNGPGVALRQLGKGQPSPDGGGVSLFALIYVERFRPLIALVKTALKNNSNFSSTSLCDGLSGTT